MSLPHTQSVLSGSRRREAKRRDAIGTLYEVGDDERLIAIREISRGTT